MNMPGGCKVEEAVVVVVVVVVGEFSCGTLRIFCNG